MDSYMIKDLKEQLKKEKELDDWAVELQRTARRERLEELKKNGLI